MSISLAETVSFSSEAEIGRSLAAIWGLFELRLNLVKEGRDPDLLASVNDRLAGFLLQYGEFVGSRLDAANNIATLGYVDTPEVVIRAMDGETVAHEALSPESVSSDAALVVGITGLIRAGKGTAGKILTERYHGLHSPFVEPLIAYSLAMGYSPDTNRAAKREVNDLIKPRFGNTSFAEAAIRRANRLAVGRNMGVLSFDGLRSVEEANLFLGSPTRRLIAIEASMETRYRRALESTDETKNGEKPKSWEDFVVDSEFERKNMMGAAIELAQVTFENEGGEAELTEKLVGYFDQIIENRQY